MDDSEIKTCCVNQGDCYAEETSCFQAIYLKKYLNAVNVPMTSEKVDVSWTRGAVICDVEGCMEKANPPVCRWSDKGCL